MKDNLVRYPSPAAHRLMLHPLPLGEGFAPKHFSIGIASGTFVYEDPSFQNTKRIPSDGPEAWILTVERVVETESTYHQA
jgi:hypothetical protein